MGRVSYSLGRDVRHDIIPVALHDHVARSKQLTTTALAQASSDRSSPAPRAEPGSRLGGSLLNGRSIVVYRSTVDIRDDILNVQPTRGTRPRMRKPRTRLRKPTTPTRGTLFPHGGHATSPAHESSDTAPTIDFEPRVLDKVRWCDGCSLPCHSPTT